MKKPIKMSYDETDLRIIEEIRDNARISYKNLSEAVNLSVPAVFERMKKMEERGGDTRVQDRRRLLPDRVPYTCIYTSAR